MKLILIAFFASTLFSFSQENLKMNVDELFGEIGINLSTGGEKIDLTNLGLISKNKFKRLYWKKDNLVMTTLEITYVDSTVSSLSVFRTTVEIKFNKSTNKVETMNMVVSDITKEVLGTQGAFEEQTFKLLPFAYYFKKISVRENTREIIKDKKYEYRHPDGRIVIYNLDFNKDRNYFTIFIVVK